MNSTPSIPSADDALKAAALMDDYSTRAKNAVSNGSRTDSFERAAADYSANADAMHGDLGTTQVINREQPVHVLMCYMQASGKTFAEIATATGYSPASVKLIAKQPWFRKRFLRITAEAGKNEVEAFLAGETMSSLETLVEIRDNANAPGNTRVSAANSILDRALGKAVQKVETESHNYQHKAETGTEIDRQIAQAEAELKSLGHTPPVAGTN